MTVNLTPKAARALECAMGLNGESKTDATCRAVQLYELWSTAVAQGGEFYLRNGKGQMRSITLL